MQYIRNVRQFLSIYYYLLIGIYCDFILVKLETGTWLYLAYDIVSVFTSSFPARSCVQVAKLPLNASFEIEAIAATIGGEFD